MNDCIWISNKIFEQEAYFKSHDYVDTNRWLRAYEIWERAEYLINRAKSAFDLSDGILNLKRSLDQRTKLIEELYGLSKIKYTNKSKYYFEVLGDFGIARPFILKKLLEIRNDIEHRDISPPRIEECKEWLDIVWYFHKSTDYITNSKRDDLAFMFEDSGLEFVFSVESSVYPYCNIDGLLLKKLYSIEEKQEHFKVESVKIETRSDLQRRYQEAYFDDMSKEDVYIHGRVKLDENTYKLLMKRFFSVY